tara:strand:+ start:180 stop:404 length:225 start_codon:yes stop_codon:yes gene_type:complete
VLRNHCLKTLSNSGVELTRLINKREKMNTGTWIAVGIGIGAAVFAATNEPVWIAVGVAIGAALGSRKPKGQNKD